MSGVYNPGDLRPVESSKNRRAKRVFILPHLGAALIDRSCFDEIVFLYRDNLVPENNEAAEQAALEETTFPIHIQQPSRGVFGNLTEGMLTYR